MNKQSDTFSLRNVISRDPLVDVDMRIWIFKFPLIASAKSKLWYRRVFGVDDQNEYTCSTLNWYFKLTMC